MRNMPNPYNLAPVHKIVDLLEFSANLNDLKVRLTPRNYREIDENFKIILSIIK